MRNLILQKRRHIELVTMFWKPCLPLGICLFLTQEVKLRCLAESNYYKTEN